MAYGCLTSPAGRKNQVKAQFVAVQVIGFSCVCSIYGSEMGLQGKGYIGRKCHVLLLCHAYAIPITETKLVPLVL